MAKKKKVSYIPYIIVVIVIIGVLFSLIYNYPFIRNSDNEKIKTQIKFLEKYYGYEVISFSYLNYSKYSNILRDTGFLEMKSLGNQKEQVWNGLWALYRVYPNAPRYTIVIFEPTRECWYDIDGNLYRNYIASSEKPDGIIIINGTEYSDLMIFSYIEEKIEDSHCF